MTLVPLDHFWAGPGPSSQNSLCASQLPGLGWKHRLPGSSETSVQETPGQHLGPEGPEGPQALESVFASCQAQAMHIYLNLCIIHI